MADAALGLRFQVTIDGQHELGNWQKCDGLNVEYDITEYREGGQNGYVHRLPGRAKYDNVKLTRPVDSSTTAVARWLASVQSNLTRGTAQITVLDPAGESVAEWVLSGVFPARWSGPSLDVNGNQVAMETLELSHNGFLGSTLMAAMFGALEKAMLIVVDGQGAPPLLRFNYNPEQYTIEKSAEWSRPKAPGPESTPDPDYTSTNPTTISMEIMFDAVEDPTGDVMHDIQTLFEWTKPTLLSRFVRNPQPPLLMFQWGLNPALATFRGFLRSVSVRYTLFHTDGRPLRATCTIRLEEVPFEIFKQNPTSGSRPGMRIHTVTEGETLHSVAWAEYRKPKYWRALAAFNSIDDPLRIEPGTTLLLPSLRDAAELS